MSFPYKNPITAHQIGSQQSVPRNNTYGVSYSVSNTGGYMEVYSLNDLYYTIPNGTTGSIEYSGNTIPIEFTKGTGDAWSPDVITLASDNISSGRRRLGMLAYVYEVDQVYQYHINDYETLFNAATASTGCAQVSDFGTTINNKTAAGQSFINAWTANTIQDVSGETYSTAVWRKFTTGAITSTSVYGSFYDTSGQTAAVINTAYPMRLNTTAESSGITIVSGSQITFASAGTFDIQFSAQLNNNKGGGAGTDVDIWLRQNGVNVPDTNTKVSVPTNNPYLVAAWDFLVTVTAGTYVELMWATDNTNISLLAQAATALHPAIPSLIVTVIPVGGGGGTEALSAGQVIKDTILSNTEVTISTTTIATSNSDTDFLTYSYTPISSSSYLIIHYHLGDYSFSSDTGNDSYISRIKVDGNEITYSKQSTVNGNRSPVLFPLTGRYTNSNTTAKSIVVACCRDSADNSITITNSATSMWLRITEIGR